MASIDFVCAAGDVVLWTHSAKFHIQILLPWVADKYGFCDFHRYRNLPLWNVHTFKQGEGA